MRIDAPLSRRRRADGAAAYLAAATAPWRAHGIRAADLGRAPSLERAPDRLDPLRGAGCR